MIIWESLVAVGGVALFASLAARFGRDSRDGVADPPQPPLGSSLGAWRVGAWPDADRRGCRPPQRT